MELTTAMQIKSCLEAFEGPAHGNRLAESDLLDPEVFEVLSGVPWVREALAEFSPTLGIEDQREVLFGLKTLAA